MSVTARLSMLTWPFYKLSKPVNPKFQWTLYLKFRNSKLRNLRISNSNATMTHLTIYHHHVSKMRVQSYTFSFIYKRTMFKKFCFGWLMTKGWWFTAPRKWLLVKINNCTLYIINYTLSIKATLLGIEPRSKEPESFILSVELQSRIYIESAKIIFF